jgi:hypothetical protein
MYVPQMVNGFYIPTETKDFNNQATVVCRIVKLGGIAYKHRETGEEWKEGAWAAVGDIVLLPRYGGFNRVRIPIPGNEEESVMFATFNDYDVVDKVTGQFEQYSKLL